MGLYQLRFPELGEGLHEGRIAKWLVKQGDLVKEDDTLAEVENDKATVELPSPVDGKIVELRMEEGATAIVGDIIVILEVAGEGAATGDPAAADMRDGAVLQAGLESVTDEVKAAKAPGASGAETPAAREVVATPGVRKFAREQGVDLRGVPGSGDNGKIARADVERFLSDKRQSTALKAENLAAGVSGAEPVVEPKAAAPFAPSTEVGGVEERVPLTSVRKIIATAMARSKYTAPHVTLMDEVNVSELVALRSEIKPLASERGVKITYLPFIVKALVAAAKKYPTLNASLDDERQELILKRYYHVGIATDTDRGLLVPVVKDADRKNMWTIAAEIEDLATRGRTGKLGPGEMKGSTISITNIGSAGGMFFTPIINFPEVAILGVGRITERPIMKDGEVVGAMMMALSLSFDHRVVDGALGQHFINAIKAMLENPRLLVMEV